MHTAKFKRTAVGQILRHIERDRPDTAKYGNRNINRDLSEYNFEVFKDMPSLRSAEARKKIDRAIEESERYTGKKVRKDAVVAVGVILTLPERYKGALDDSQLAQFFGYAGLAIGQTYGITKEQILTATVHRDETTPHMHLVFMPYDQESHTFCAKKIINQRAMQSLHDRVDRTLKANLKWYTGGVILTDDERLEKYGFKDKRLWRSNLKQSREEPRVL